MSFNGKTNLGTDPGCSPPHSVMSSNFLVCRFYNKQLLLRIDIVKLCGAHVSLLKCSTTLSFFKQLPQQQLLTQNTRHFKKIDSQASFEDQSRPELDFEARKVCWCNPCNIACILLRGAEKKITLCTGLVM